MGNTYYSPHPPFTNSPKILAHVYAQPNETFGALAYLRLFAKSFSTLSVGRYCRLTKNLIFAQREDDSVSQQKSVYFTLLFVLLPGHQPGETRKAIFSRKLFFAIGLAKCWGTIGWRIGCHVHLYNGLFC